jgi:hypothetical protein
MARRIFPPSSGGWNSRRLRRMVKTPALTAPDGRGSINALGLLISPSLDRP